MGLTADAGQPDAEIAEVARELAEEAPDPETPEPAAGA